jgi:hypothetical protein
MMRPRGKRKHLLAILEAQLDVVFGCECASSHCLHLIDVRCDGQSGRNLQKHRRGAGEVGNLGSTLPTATLHKGGRGKGSTSWSTFNFASFRACRAAASSSCRSCSNCGAGMTSTCTEKKCWIRSTSRSASSCSIRAFRFNACGNDRQERDSNGVHSEIAPGEWGMHFSCQRGADAAYIRPRDALGLGAKCERVQSAMR